MKAFAKAFGKLVDFLYALFFTRDDDLDILQVLFATIVIVALLVIWNVSVNGTNNDAVKIEGLVTLRWLTGLLVITAVPKWLVPLMSKHTKSLPMQIEKKEEEPPVPTGF